MKITTRLFLVLAVLVSAASNADSYTMRSMVEAKLPSWGLVEPQVTEWVNVGDPAGCTAWSPELSSVASGEEVVQSRTCSQNQQRSVITQEQEKNSGQIRVVSESVEDRTASLEFTQTGTGTMATGYVWGSATHMNHSGWGPYSDVYDGWLIEHFAHTYAQNEGNAQGLPCDYSGQRRNYYELKGSGDSWLVILAKQFCVSA